MPRPAGSTTPSGTVSWKDCFSCPSILIWWYLAETITMPFSGWICSVSVTQASTSFVTSLPSLSLPLTWFFSHSFTHEPSGALASFFAWADAGCGWVTLKRSVAPSAAAIAMAPTRVIRAPTPVCRNELAILLLTFPCKTGPVPTEARCLSPCDLRMCDLRVGQAIRGRLRQSHDRLWRTGSPCHRGWTHVASKQRGAPLRPTLVQGAPSQAAACRCPPHTSAEPVCCSRWCTSRYARSP